MKQVDKSVADYDQSNVGAKHEGEESVLQKLLKIDRHYAVVMTLDMLSAGIDTVCRKKHIGFPLLSNLLVNFRLQTPSSIYSICSLRIRTNKRNFVLKLSNFYRTLSQKSPNKLWIMRRISVEL